MVDGGVRCRVEGCTYSYKPRPGCNIAELLGCRPGDVDLGALRLGVGVTYRSGDTLNNVSSYCGSFLQHVRQAMVKHHRRMHKELPLPVVLKGCSVATVESAREGSRLREKAYRERRLRDVRFLQERAFVTWKQRCPRPSRKEWLVPVAEVEFAPWVKVMKVQPQTSDMLVGRREFSFANPWLRAVDQAFGRLSRFDSSLDGAAARDVQAVWRDLRSYLRAFCSDFPLGDYLRESVDEHMLQRLDFVNAMVEAQEKAVFLGEKRLDGAVQLPCVGLNMLKEFVCEKDVGYVGEVVCVEKVKDYESRLRLWSEGRSVFSNSYINGKLQISDDCASSHSSVASSAVPDFEHPGFSPPPDRGGGAWSVSSSQ
eukprot:454738_1